MYARMNVRKVGGCAEAGQSLAGLWSSGGDSPLARRAVAAARASTTVRLSWSRGTARRARPSGKRNTSAVPSACGVAAR
jgi:hypothetical protein